MKPVIFPMILRSSFSVRLQRQPSCFIATWALLPLLAASTSRSYISASARLYSFGKTLTNLVRAVAQLSSSSRARLLPVQRLCSSSSFLQQRLVGLVLVQPGLAAAFCSAAVPTCSSDTMEVLQRLANSPSSSYT